MTTPWLEASQVTYNDRSSRRPVNPAESLFHRDDPQIKQDIIRIILQYLHEENLPASRITLHDEANCKWKEWEEQQLDMLKIRKSILDGEWAEVDKLCGKTFMRNQKPLLYAVYRQQYLELIDARDLQKAFNFLNKKLKPLEAMQAYPTDFHDLCYLLSCGSSTSTSSSASQPPNTTPTATPSNNGIADTFKSWDGVMAEREKLVDKFRNIMQLESATDEAVAHVPPSRLILLLRQAIAYQIDSGQYHPNVIPKISTLLFDYQTVVVPNACRLTMHGHRNNVKCVAWVGDEGLRFASGSSDCSIKLWDTESGACLDTINAHISKVWDCSSNSSGSCLASVGGDGIVKLWDLRHSKFTCMSAVKVSAGDLYSVKYHPGERHVVTGGYDKVVRLLDASRGDIIQSFSGHDLSISSCTFNPYGNLVISGSKDNSIKFWDITSGLCVKTIATHLGEVTSVDISGSGAMLLSSSKDNSIRLWDIRMIRPTRRFKGHQNTSKNFIRASFASNSLVVSGSEDGRVNVWDIERSEPLRRLGGHEGAVYMAAWNASQNKWISCSDDRTLKMWWLDVESKQ
eukprot:Partr_v1_DN27631_c0_g1_i4_m65018 putative WD40